MTGTASLSFSCLWCGTPHSTRSPDDLAAWARLCPDCLGRAGDNEFLRFRLKRALEDRAAHSASSRSADAPDADSSSGARD